MRVPFYDIKAQYDELHPQLDAAVHEVLSSGAYVMGKNHKAFEEDIAALHKVKHGIACNSGTDALRMMLDAAGIGAGDEVITTAFTFVASAEVIAQTGASPVFVDIVPHTYNIDPDKIEAAVTTRTKAIMPIHLFGQLCEMEPIMEIARRHNLIVLEDAAQALGSERNGKPAGNWGQSAGISFYVTKNLGAAGDGGLILTNNDEVAEKARSMRVHGMGRERYYYDHIGYTSRMHEIQAAVLHTKLQRLTAWNARRNEIANLYATLLQGSEISLPITSGGNNNTWHQFSIRHSRRDDLQAFLKGQEVDSMIYYPVALHHHTPYKRFSPAWPLEETERATKEILNLPIHPHLADDQVRHVCASIMEFQHAQALA
ncbi:MAG: DegT/DnrJ/EryC1/StrS family aminotransferase [Fimbriimonadaceae bacterium]